MFCPASTLTAGTAKATYQAGLAAIRGGQTSIDLAGLTTVDSTAVAALVGWQRAAVQQGSSLALLNPSAALHSLASLYGVSDLLQLPLPAPRTDLPHH